jgi:immune inhibitor A
MFYINVTKDHWPGSDSYDFTLAHEFQHMIHWNQDRNEEAWLNEGLSVLAVALNGAPNSGYIRPFLRQPDTQLTTWAVGGEDPSPHYGAGYLFATYFLDHFGAETLKSVVRSELNGRASFDAVLAQSGSATRFDDVFADWVVANYLDDKALEAGRYGYRDLMLDDLTVASRHEQYPATITDTVHQYGADYIVLAGDAPRPLTIHFAGQTETHLAELSPHGGRWTWWSNRGDQVDCTLTRAFDLRGVQTATLSAWMWYDIEESWDYAYIAVSTDGGQKWDILEGPATRRDNPNGNSLGPAYTGVSGGGKAPAWAEERIDLSRYAGRQILLRFELVTDDAVNLAGLFLDDISIPEIGYRDDMEAGQGGWVGAGFVRNDNRLPQRYLVQVIQYEAGRPVIKRMELDGEQRGEMEIAGLGPELGQAVVVVSALAPHTTEPAQYEVVVEPAP